MVQSVDRALAILELLATGPGELGVTEVGARLEVHKSTASRLLATLTEHDLVETNPANGKYRLGFGVIRLAGAVAASNGIVLRAQAALQTLASGSNEAVNLSVLERGQVVSLHQITTPHLVGIIDWVGRHTPIHCSSSGKAILAHLPPADRKRLLAGPLERRTRRTVIDRAKLDGQLAQARRDGYAFTVEELEVGLHGVAAPVWGTGGRVVAAVSVSGPSFRLTEARIPALGAMAKAAAAQISRELGYVGASVAS